MIQRWSRDQVLALAPDASSRTAAQGVASPAKWMLRGVSDDIVFGTCRGSGARPYHTCVDLDEPAYLCSCPSRKVPCKHVLGLLLLWSGEGLPEVPLPAWAAEWVGQRFARAEARAARLDFGSGVEVSGSGGADVVAPVASGGRGPGPAGVVESARQARVAIGLTDLERWLADQVRQGLAAADPDDWHGLSKRLVDAQAPGAAGIAGRLAHVLGRDGWPSRLLAEYALLHLLVVAYRRRDELPADLARTVMQRVGFTVNRDVVLAGPRVRDVWDVLGRRDEELDRVSARRVWLRGRDTGRAAMVLTFAPPGQAPDASFVPGTAIDAELAFYPGASPVRAILAHRHSPLGGLPVEVGQALSAVPPALTADEALAEVAGALAGDPWIDSWPLVLAGVVPEAGHVSGLPWHPAEPVPWRLIAVSGGHPVTVAVEWTPDGLRPLSAWDDDGRVVLL
ncbi:SWIM zinc finger family protein [Nonomuraea sp. NPDC050663]|uniref:SWIM zinc finger family protein n=1 Tax=Nonomuraea sp. NPDC050663 TaxID=3364370 RepID=UPI0037B96413